MLSTKLFSLRVIQRIIRLLVDVGFGPIEIYQHTSQISNTYLVNN